MSRKQRRELKAALLQGPTASGFDRPGWTCALVCELIERRFGVRFHVDYVGTLLHELNWSPQLPQQKARERNEQDIEHWRRDIWPQIKKGDRTRC